MPTNRRSRIRRGITSAELLIGVIVVGLIGAWWAGQAAQQRRDAAARNAATHLLRVGEAAQAYVTANMATLDASAAASGGRVTVPVSTVLSGGAGHSGLSATAPIGGHTLCLAVRRVSAGVLEPMLIARGGVALPSTVLGEIKSAGGFDVGEVDGTTIYGSGGWSVPAANYAAGACAPQNRSYVLAMFVNSSTLGSSFLNRFEVPGAPEMTRMQAHTVLGNTCDDPATAATETNAACGIRSQSMSATEPSFDLSRIRLINSLHSGQYPAAYNGGSMQFAGTARAANMTVDDVLRVSGYHDSRFFLRGGHGDTQLRLSLKPEANGLGTGELSLQAWVSEPNHTWDGAGFGYNVTNSSGFPRLNNNVGQGFVRFSGSGGMTFYAANTAGTRTEPLVLNPNGTVRTGPLTSTGDIQATGVARATAFLHSSDQTLKTPGRRIADAVDLVRCLEGYRFEWLKDGRPDLSTIAQNVQRCVPDLVLPDPQTGKLMVSDPGLIAILIEAVKAQDEQLATQGRVIEAMQADIAAVKSEMRTLRGAERP